MINLWYYKAKMRSVTIFEWHYNYKCVYYVLIYLRARKQNADNDRYADLYQRAGNEDTAYNGDDE